MTTARLQWEELPASRVAVIEDHAGPIVKAETVTSGLMPGLAAVLYTQDGRYFIKAVPEHNPAYPLHQREMTANAALLAPRLIQAGHSPADTENLLSQLPAYQTAPAADITVLAALWTMFREYQALHGPHDDRAFRARAAQAGRSWISHRTR